MSGDGGRASEAIGIRVDTPMTEAGRNERGFLVVSRFDEDQTSWLSGRLGGRAAGKAGFVQPQPADFARYNIAPYSETVSEHSNLITTGGWDRLLTLGIAGGGQAWDATHTRIGAGTATAVAASGQTDLSAATGPTNRFWQTVTGAGTVGTGTGVRRLSFVSTFGTGDGNFVWAEWAIDQGTATGTGTSTTPLLNRAVSAQGTKASGQTWTATALLDFS